MKKSERLSTNLSFSTAFCLFSLVPAFYVWNNILNPLMAVIFAGLCLFDIAQHGYNRKNIFGAIILFLFYFIHCFRSGQNIFGCMVIIFVSPVFFLQQKSLLLTYEKFCKILAFLFIPSIIVYILVVLLGVALPNLVIEPLNHLKRSTYYLFPFLVTDSVFGILTPRFFGWFDEPGVVGTICGVILIIESFNLKNWQNIVFLISGLLSLSMFFFVVCAVYILIKAPWKYKVVTVFVIYVALYFLQNNDTLYELLFSRFELTDDGMLYGDNRASQSFNDYYELFRKSPDYLWGLGAGVGNKLNPGGSSYKQFVVSYGIIHFVFYLIGIFFYSIRNQKNLLDFVVFALLIFGVMYQRPFFTVYPLVFLIAVFSCIKSANEIKKRSAKYETKREQQVISYSTDSNL